MSNPLTADRQDSTQSFSGVRIAESVDETKKAVENGDWASAVMGSVTTALDGLSTVMDPLGELIAAGVGWLMEHVGPVSDALDEQTDDMELSLDTWGGPEVSFEETSDPTSDQIMSAVNRLDSRTHTEVSLTRDNPFEFISISGGRSHFLVSGESSGGTFVQMTTPNADPNETIDLACGGQQDEFSLQEVVPRNRTHEAVEQFLAGLSAKLPETWSVE